MTHKMKLNPKPFEKIAAGTKTIELRLYDEKRRAINIGDTIEFTNTENGKTIAAVVVNLFALQNFNELYETLPLTKCGYTAENVSLATPSDMEQYYSKEQQQKYGVVGIEIKPITMP